VGSSSKQQVVQHSWVQSSVRNVLGPLFASSSRDINNNGASASIGNSNSNSDFALHASTLLDSDTDLDVRFIDAKKRAVLESFVKRMDGKRPIQRVLVANNGMAATKAIMSIRQWAYVNLGDERAIEFVAMATRDDLNANAEFIRLADTFVEVPSGSNKNNYANVDLIVQIAVEQGVDAVWPGWGHASENPRLPSTLKSKGIQFIGPTAPVMAALGDKVCVLCCALCGVCVCVA